MIDRTGTRSLNPSKELTIWYSVQTFLFYFLFEKPYLPYEYTLKMCIVNSEWLVFERQNQADFCDFSGQFT